MNRETMEDEYLRRQREEVEICNSAVKSPSHYMFFDTEAINIIKASLTEEEFRGYLKGNALKYRLRCGKKDDAMQDLKKAEQYESMFKDMV